ncbi:LysR substrate-binding domain-containing protein [Aestuariivita boseongensis]|uniref:LysR substrate-binding domain-containing protein n=1 Tax=Aestuariivita boseongensis TaxID=1470562 RepID=UPI0006808A9F|nr:LysR substrate-binding domain-containing protein [Aestuariivita boseongensis]
MIAPRRFLPSIASLRALEAVDRLGSASAAAEELSLTQGAISRQLQALEKQMGLQLVLRTGKKLTLTDPARAYAAETRAALQQIAQASLRLQSQPTEGKLNLAILPAFGMRWLMPRLPDFARRYPDITINMGTELVPFAFASRSYDAALHYGTGDWPGTDRLLLRHERMIPVCAPDLVRGPVGPEDVLRYPLMHIQTRPDAWADWLRVHGVEAGQMPDGTIYDQYATIIQAALHGLGIALIPDYLAEQDRAAGKLVSPFGEAAEARGAYYLVWPRARSADPALRQFRDWLAGQAQPEDPLPR